MAFHIQPTEPVRHNKTVSPAAIIEQFNNPLECLTAHLLYECSEVLAGVKPANLISLVDRTRSCGRNLYQLWQQHQQQIAATIKTVDFVVLQTRQRSLLMLCYNRDLLEQQLSHGGIRALLAKAGYHVNASLAELLEELQQRIRQHDTFPHEIGLFIGYPAKDVAGFMGVVKLPFTCQGPWKIYGRPEESLNLAKQFRDKRICMGSKLLSCTTVDSCLTKLNSNRQLFFASQLIT